MKISKSTHTRCVVTGFSRIVPQWTREPVCSKSLLDKALYQQDQQALDSKIKKKNNKNK